MFQKNLKVSVKQTKRFGHIQTGSMEPFIAIFTTNHECFIVNFSAITPGRINQELI